MFSICNQIDAFHFPITSRFSLLEYNFDLFSSHFFYDGLHLTSIWQASENACDYASKVGEKYERGEGRRRNERDEEEERMSKEILILVVPTGSWKLNWT